VRFYTKNGHFAFLISLGGLEVTCDDHLRLIGKRVMDFLLVLVELFSLGITAEALRANIGSKSAISLQRGPVYPKLQVEGAVPTNHFSCHKTKVNGLSCGVRMWAQLAFVLSQITRFTDGQTDRQTDRILIVRPRLYSMQRGKT